jgi:hypothetical protein
VANLNQVRAAKAKLKDEVGGRADVVGIGIGGSESSYFLKVNLRTRATGNLPQTVDGVPVEYEVVGTVRPLSRSGG